MYMCSYLCMCMSGTVEKFIDKSISTSIIGFVCLSNTNTNTSLPFSNYYF